MKTLQEIRKSFCSLGFSPELHPFNHMVLRFLCMAFLTGLLLWIFFIHVADSAQEYLETIYLITAYNGIFLSFASTIFIAEKLFIFFNNVDKISNESKRNFVQ